jgi:thioesterase domain-containing protein
MIPKAFVTLEKLPLTSNGKIDRNSLSVQELERASSEVFDVAPRTPIEDVLAAIWCEILGVKQIGARDAFFAMGGHSLQVTQLLAKIERLFNQRVSFPAFFQNPTIEGLSKALQEPKPGRSNQLTPLRVGKAPGTVFFLDAEIGLCRLARLLTTGPTAVATAVPLRSSELQALEWAGQLPSLESIAAAHVALIRTYHRSGPCLLAGYSFGGVLAYEVAQQLQRQRIVVEKVLLLDSWATTPIWWQKLKAGRKNHSLPGYLQAMIRIIPEGAIRFATLAKSYGFSSRGSGQPNLPFAEPDAVALLKFLRRIRDAYKFRPLDCRAVLFRCQDDFYSTHTLNGQMGWEGLFGRGLEIIETPGDHASLLKEPNLQELATRIDSLLDVLRRAGSPPTFNVSAGTRTGVITVAGP